MSISDGTPVQIAKVFFQQGLLGKAELMCRLALVFAPADADAFAGLGQLYQSAGHHRPALLMNGRALGVNDQDPLIWLAASGSYQALGQSGAAIAACRRALTLAPGEADAFTNLGFLLHRQGLSTEAGISYRHSIAVGGNPGFPTTNLATIIQAQGDLLAAIDCYRRSLCFEPQAGGTYNNLGNTVLELAQVDDAVAAYRRALRLDPGYSPAHSNLLFALNYHPTLAENEIYNEYMAWDRKIQKPSLSERPPGLGDRRLKVGYLSADLRQHSMRHFLEPLLSRHDKDLIEVFAYSNLAQEDDVTPVYRLLADHWRPIHALDDSALAEMIRQDGIDILVDLSGHTAANRLPVFAVKPAPIQLSWSVGFGYTSGLSSMDYFLADPVLAPKDAAHLFAEHLVHLSVYAAFRPAPGLAQPGPLPAGGAGCCHLWLPFPLAACERQGGRCLGRDPEPQSWLAPAA